MEKIIIDFIKENYPIIFCMLVSAGFIAYASIFIYKIYKKNFDICNNHSKLKEKQDNMQSELISLSRSCDNHSELEKEQSKMQEKLDLLLNKFSNLIAVLSEKKSIGKPSLFQVKSPVSLTEDGLKLVSEVNFKNIINNDKKRNEIFNLLDKLHLKTKADVERYCIIILDELYSSRDINPLTEVKQYLYEHASIDKQDALYACSLYLRDKYLKINQEI